MLKTNKYFLSFLFFLTTVFGSYLFLCNFNYTTDDFLYSVENTYAFSGKNTSALPFNALAARYRIASRLKDRLAYKKLKVPSLNVLVKALEERQNILKKKTLLRLIDNEDNVKAEQIINLADHPSWAGLETTYTGAEIIFREELLRNYLEKLKTGIIEEPQDVKLTNIYEDNKILKADLTGNARAGYELNTDLASQAVKKALVAGLKQVTVVLNARPGRIINETDFDLGELSFLAGGMSNFHGSTWAREKNVNKAIYEHITNTIVPPGAELSFNSLLNEPVTTGNGWYMAKVIVSGDQLIMAPGGGICQTSTTVFRAVANAGLKLIDYRNHSIYVNYYEKYGVGLDATVFPGSQDLVFENDTEGYLLIQAYIEGEDVYVNIYGTPDNRQIALKGPYFKSNAPDDFTYNGRKLYGNEIAWKQEITYKDGEKKENIFISRYIKGIPAYVIRRNTAEEKNNI